MSVTAVQSVGLIVLEVRYRADLKPALLCRTPHFKVVADGRREAHVAPAEAQNVIGELKFDEELLYVVEHFGERLVGVLWCVDAYDFHFVELVEAVKSANVLSIATGLSSEARRVGAALDGQVALIEYFVPENVSYGHFGRGYQVEIVELCVIHLSLFVGQLSSTQSRCLVDQQRRLNLQVAALACLVEEESLKGALKACHLTYIYRESRTGDFHTEVEIHKVVFLAQVPMAERFSAKRRLLSAFLHHYVVAGVASLRHFFAGNVGNGQQHFSHAGLCLVHLLLKGLVGGLELGHTVFYFVGFVFLSLLHQAPDLSGKLVLLLLVAVELLLAFAANPVELQYLLDGFAGSLEVFLFETFDYTFCFFTDKL